MAAPLSLRFLGPLGRAKEAGLRARCLLVSSLAPETSSLVAMEALASGTPVVACARATHRRRLRRG
jgi:glycosyltransferase involved in cell wall biosynthesis